MMLPKDDITLTNILGMTKKEVIFTLYINRQDLNSPDDAIRLYHRMVEHGIIDERDQPDRSIRDIHNIIPDEILNNMQKNKTCTEGENDQPCYIERHKNFESDLVKDIDKILGDKKENQSQSKSLTPITDEDFKKIVSKNTNIKL